MATLGSHAKCPAPTCPCAEPHAASVLRHHACPGCCWMAAMRQCMPCIRSVLTMLTAPCSFVSDRTGSTPA